MTTGHKRQPIVYGAWNPTRRRPDSVVEIVIGAHHEFVVFWSLIARHVVTSVVVKVNALKIADVAVAVRQQHVESSVVHYEAIEINWRQWKDSLDAIRRAQRLI